ncbi:PREDICTED: alpha-catulin [Dufourea novaeangliae]|uniref:Alpha-catulin n=1 Tax=Dufourea novaeangliae TaxID=178035 RepID=A0A154P371_DUFNO|nr:PREDICTED: alpha-catulin [Dufourea novaeangliae]KZC05580.1 Alpha-catulin [Dufourea novaeangliae]
MATPEPLDPSTLEIKTRSIEQTLLPLVKQISTLVSYKERSQCSCRSYRAVDRIGQAVNLAVERFVTVGETIADNNPEIKVDMYHACEEARVCGSAIEKLCECMMDDNLADRSALIKASKSLLGWITRVLLVADVVVVNRLLSAKDKVASILDRLEDVSNFTEFVKAFSQFGTEMVDLAHLTGDRQIDLIDERRRAQMAVCRQILERSTMMLLTSSKTYLRHPECPAAKENRDTVFCQMRRAMDMIHFIVKDGVVYRHMRKYLKETTELDWERKTALFSLQHFEGLVETTRMTLLGPESRSTLLDAFNNVIDRTQDFTDSAYTSHEHRENILLLCDRVQLELNYLLRVGNTTQSYEGGSGSPSAEMEQAVQAVFKATKELRQVLCTTAMEQMTNLGQVTKAGLELVSTIKNLALANDINSFEEKKFKEYLDHIVEVCRMIRHVAPTETLSVSAKFTGIHLEMYGPQVLTAAHTLAKHPTSKIAKENLEVFADMWQWLMNDVTSAAKDVLEWHQNQPEKQVYMSLPRPGKHGTTSKPLKPAKLDSEEQAKIAKAGLEMKLITSEMDAETDRWQESGSALEENNDIAKRAKNMSSMALSMYQFTKGEGDLKTTQDLFTQAEYFAEEANRLYKVVRQFSYQVPGGPHKTELLTDLDRVPMYVQMIQFAVMDPTVGKAATFRKVDKVIHETKNLMYVISKVVTACFDCATKHNLTMPQYVELSPSTMHGLSEEECLYPVSPQLLPSTSPYVQPHPLTSVQLHNILRTPSLNFSSFNYNTLPITTNSAINTGPRNSASFVHPSVLPYSSSNNATSGCGPQAPNCLQNLQLLQLQLHHAQLQHLRHATLPR